MDESARLLQQFEQERRRLHAVAHRMLGSVSDAEDAVQEAWLRFSRSDKGDVENLSAWLTTVIAHISLSMMRSRKRRREQLLDAVDMADLIVTPEPSTDAAYQVELADSTGLALMVVLEALSPPERLAFVLYDIFGVPFDDVATILERSPTAVRQLASRARRRVRGAPVPDRNLRLQRKVADAFFAAAHQGDFEALVAVLYPDAVLRSDGGPGVPLTTVISRAKDAAVGALTFVRLAHCFVLCS